MILSELLEPAARAPGVIGALVVSREDGLVVAGRLQPNINGKAVAALAASLARRSATLAAVLGEPEPPILELEGTEGSVLAAPGRAGLLLVAVMARGANPLPARTALVRLAEQVG
ncbi:MAG: roadblock/LC7 domain-containing protein [Gemmatimonadales bacterium]